MSFMADKGQYNQIYLSVSHLVCVIFRLLGDGTLLTVYGTGKGRYNIDNVPEPTTPREPSSTTQASSIKPLTLHFVLLCVSVILTTVNV